MSVGRSGVPVARKINLGADWGYGGRMLVLDPIASSRELERAADVAWEWQAKLRSEPDPLDDPFEPHRALLGRTQFCAIAELPVEDPMRSPLLRWTHALMDQRINRRWLVRVHELRHHERHGIGAPVRGEFTLNELVHALLAEPQRRRVWWDALAERTERASSAERMLWQRRAHVASELGLESFDVLTSPSPECERLAQQHLDECAAMLVEFRREAPFEWLETPLDRSSGEWFPARLNEHLLADWFREGRLLDELRLRDWTLPRVLGPASFMRALDEFGREWRRAGAPRKQPFVVAHDPFELSNHVFGACFASLLLEPSFLERRLGMARAQQREPRRRMARVVVIEWTVRALKVLLRAAALRAPGELPELFSELVSRYFGPNVPPTLALVWLRVYTDTPQRFAAVALGYALARRLREQHDEDWFRHPRAIEELRALAELSPRVDLDPVEVEAGGEQLRAELFALLQ